MSNRILLIEDDDSLRDVLRSVLEHEQYVVDAYSNGEGALDALGKNSYALILCDFKLPGKNGLELLKDVREHSKSVPFLIMTAYGSIEIAVEAMKYGANDFLCKPFEPENLCSIISDMIEHRRILDRSLGTRTRRDRSFLSENAAVQKLLTQAKRVARVDTSVLILGESGTGKELVARLIHEHSARSNEPFLAVNCAAMPAELLESEFFGHEAGSFTGATQTRIGVFELASSGTIFLDEIGDMPLSLQVKLLRALQEREIKRVGGNKVIEANPRVIAATNHDIEESLNEGRLREDFYYRLAVVTFTIPALRERPEDIPLLSRFYIDYFCHNLGRDPLNLEADAEQALRAYSWPGNARELENVIERAVVLAENSIRAEHLGLNPRVDLDSISESVRTLPEIAANAMRKAEIDLIQRTLKQTFGNKTKAAQILGVSYKTLLNKVKEYEIEARPPEESHPLEMN